MKKILITGVNSYVGNSFEQWLNDYPNDYIVEKVSLRDGSWKKIDFSTYDVILHVAGIAHVSTDPNLEELYYKINRDLTIDIANKAKSDGVSQFVFLSSIIVYGQENIINKIDSQTNPKPDNFYGASKLQAEKGIINLQSRSFKVAILRPPMIYGRGSKGNYPKLAIVSKKFPFFPNYDNERSMLHIDNLCEFIRLIINNGDSGVYFPQNKDYVKTKDMVSLIAQTQGKKIILISFFNPIIRLLVGKVTIINKVFGNLVYDKKISEYKESYQIRDFKQSIVLTEKSRLNK